MAEPRAAAIDVVLDILDTEGYGAVRVRDVASRSRVSSKTIYKVFGSREDLITAAISRWMEQNVYAKIEVPTSGESFYDAGMRFYRNLFEPWERHPKLLEAYHRAQLGPGGAQLRDQVRSVAEQSGRLVIEHSDPGFIADVTEITRNVADGLIGRFVHGEIDVHDIVPGLEVAIARLTNTPPKGRLR